MLGALVHVTCGQDMGLACLPLQSQGLTFPHSTSHAWSDASLHISACLPACQFLPFSVKSAHFRQEGGKRVAGDSGGCLRVQVYNQISHGGAGGQLPVYKVAASSVLRSQLDTLANFGSKGL
jgi:hypothetical protein